VIEQPGGYGSSGGGCDGGIVHSAVTLFTANGNPDDGCDPARSLARRSYRPRLRDS
jgi:hypothetical protein